MDQMLRRRGRENQSFQARGIPIWNTKP